MKIYYISPSTIPSRSANSIHVVNMVEGLTQLNFEVSLFLHSNSLDSNSCHQEIANYYGVSNNNIKAFAYTNTSKKGIELGIALKAFNILVKDVLNKTSPKHIISRNLYAAFLFALVLRKKIIYETHSPEKGLRGLMQKLIVSSKLVKTIVISNALKKIMSEIYGNQSDQINVFHDAARSGRNRISSSQRKKLQKNFISSKVNLDKYEKVIGYFGHLYSGRGIEIIENLAHLNPKHIFIVYGGNDQEINKFKQRTQYDNLIFMGHSSPNQIYDAMTMMDILLMPYQEKVSIGIDNVNTVEWMSPMKMFEYMSVGVPIISSNLTVLREVLKNEENCILVKPNDIEEWSNAIERLSSSSGLSERLGNNAFNDYYSKYTWKKRAQAMIKLSN